ncbi:hypothetical protein Bpfe_018936, partial [Biomphalaria pfeifferi]
MPCQWSANCYTSSDQGVNVLPVGAANCYISYEIETKTCQHDILCQEHCRESI